MPLVDVRVNGAIEERGLCPSRMRVRILPTLPFPEGGARQSEAQSALSRILSEAKLVGMRPLGFRPRVQVGNTELRLTEGHPHHALHSV
jgi:hypothetical protein